MADPTETLGIETGNPDSGTAGLGLVTPDLLAQERAMQWRNMLASPIAQVRDSLVDPLGCAHVG